MRAGTRDGDGNGVAGSAMKRATTVTGHRETGNAT